MSGFVGSRAKRRKRRYIYFFIIIFIICIFVFFNPNIKLILDPPIPEENIIPEKNEEIFSDMSKIEDLKLKVFQSEQKLNFRNIEIKKLKDQIINLKKINTEIELNYNTIKEEYANFIELDKSSETIKIDNDDFNDLNSEISNLKILNKKNINLISELKKEIIELESQNNKILNDSDTLKKEYKKIISKNVKLKSQFDSLEKTIEEQGIEIKKLKDTSHHKK